MIISNWENLCFPKFIQKYLSVVRFGLQVRNNYHENKQNYFNDDTILCCSSEGGNLINNIGSTPRTNYSGHHLTLKALKYFFINHGDHLFFQFEIVINVLVSCFRLIWIPMLCVYNHCRYNCYSFSSGTDFRRQNMRPSRWKCKYFEVAITTYPRVDILWPRFSNCNDWPVCGPDW